MARLRKNLGQVAGGQLFLQAVQDIRVGGRQSNAQYQYTVLGDSVDEVYRWAPKLLAVMQKDPTFTDVNSDQQQKGLETDLVIDRETASRLGLTMYQIDNSIYDAFGQRSVSTIYNALNQYHVVMEVAPQYWQNASMLKQIWVSTSGAAASGSATTALGGGSVTAPTKVTGPSAIKPPVGISLSSTAASQSNTSAVPGRNPTILIANPTVLGGGASGSAGTTSGTTNAANNAVRTAAQASLATTGNATGSSGSAVATSYESMVPLSAFSHFGPGSTPLAVNHQSQFVATTISFNLPASKSLSDAQTAIEKDKAEAGLPSDLIGGFAGTALVYQQSLGSEKVLVLAALAAIYIVLGVLYESFIHPITILSTLPSAGVGAILALLLFGIQFTVIALIGVILLIGIVKKNAILMIDFALEAERNEGMDSREAIFHAAVMRFRPITMTTCAAILGALPLCFSFGEGAELRQPLGISIVGGLLFSQALTLFTTAHRLSLSRSHAVPGGRHVRPTLGAAESTSMRSSLLAGLGMALATLLATGGCMVGPDYQKPAEPMELSYKELAGWQPAQPADASQKGAWWQVYHDDLLNQLESKVAISNQNVKTYAAQYAEAQEEVQIARAQLFPTLGATTGIQRGKFRGGGGTSALTGTSTGATGTTGIGSTGTGSTGIGSTGTGTTSAGGGGTITATGGSVSSGPETEITLEATASWDLDLWGRIRRQVQSDVAAAQVSAADLANATLSAQGSLATDYLQLRYEDSLQDLLTATVKAYAETLRITHDQVEAGTTSPLDEAQALTQLQAAKAQLVNVGEARGQYEHAIAVLAGETPAELTIPHAPLAQSVPVPPTGLPSTLLQRRPDVAAAERMMDEENALIGVQVAAYYPDVTLSADFGWEATAFRNLFSAANRIWSLGANASETIFEGGERSAAVAQARDAYDASVATYRQTVLSALQQVEDELVALHVLQDQAAAEDVAVKAAENGLDIALNEYQAGTVAYTTVVTQQTALLTDQQTQLQVLEQRMVASAALIQALGGSWNKDQLPSRDSLQDKLPFM